MTNQGRAYLLAQRKKPSAWRGLVLVLTSLGVSISTEQSEAIVAAGMAIAGLIGLFAPDQSSTT